MKRINVHIKRQPSDYPIIIQPNLLSRCGRIIKSICPDAGRRAAIITDRTVAALHLPKLVSALKSAGITALPIVIPAGEAQKSFNRVQQLYNTLLKRRLERTDIIVALGGGVVGDIAGFTAATFMRGIRFVQIPTTLLAQVDAGIGGKTGINFGGKNIIGAFHQPAAVLIDPTVLRTLPPHEFYNGMAEVIKSAVIRSPALLGFLQQNKAAILSRQPDALEEMITSAARIKAGIVAQDEREEKGKRTVLNYGHTLGHALEQTGHYQACRHGEAVAIGMTVAARIAVKIGLTDKKLLESQTALLEAYHLPTVPRHRISPAKLVSALQSDKKMKGGRCYFVLPCRIGRTRICAVPIDIIKETIRTK